MEEDRISARQLMVLLAVALLAPGTGALPRRMAALAGGLSWLAPLLALPVVLILAWALQFFTSRDLRRLGPIYLAWGLLLLGQALGQVGAQLPQRGYAGAAWLPVALLLGLSLRLAGGKLCTLARGAEIFYLVLALALGAVLLLSLPRAEVKNLAPLRPEDLGGLPLAAVDLLGVLSVGSIAALLGDRITP
ncbi:MAG: spore gernimation protein, partial [Pseudoflavonifractor sp.]